MRTIVFILGVLIVLLGALWLLQGLGLVVMAPILCFADCVPVAGPSILWSIIGLLTIVAGGAMVARARGRRPPV